MFALILRTEVLALAFVYVVMQQILNKSTRWMSFSSVSFFVTAEIGVEIDFVGARIWQAQQSGM